MPTGSPRGPSGIWHRSDRRTASSRIGGSRSSPCRRCPSRVASSGSRWTEVVELWRWYCWKPSSPPRARSLCVTYCRKRRADVGILYPRMQAHPFVAAQHNRGRLQGCQTQEKALDPKGRALHSDRDDVGAYALALATTVLRQGFSTTSASNDATMLAPAAITNTVSQC